MAMIKCPECGHSISDHAPVCPSCGVQINGNIVKCPECGTDYLKELGACPVCAAHHQAAPPASTPATSVQEGAVQSQTTAPQTPKPQSNKNRNIIIVSVVIALLVCATAFYFYKNAQNAKEADAYEFAMKSNEPGVLQDYLATFTDAPRVHLDSIQARLLRLGQMDTEWTNALVSNSKDAIEQYLLKNPNSIHKPEALRKIDSLDWLAVCARNTPEAYQTYLDEHFDGAYVEDARNNLKQIKSKEVQQDEYQMISSTFRAFFQGLNERNEAKLTSAISPNIASFLNKTDVTTADIVSFMNKLYKENVEKMQWKAVGDIKIKKKEIGVEEYEYNVSLMATQDVQYKDEKTEHNKYKVQARIDPTGKIVEYTMSKLLE